MAADRSEWAELLRQIDPEGVTMRPLPSADLYVQTRTPEAPRRRSKRKGKKPKSEEERRLRWLRTERFAMRLEKKTKDAWTFAASREGFLSLSDWVRETCDGRARTRALMSSDVDSHNTPQLFLDAIAPMGPIGLDPCSNATSIVRAVLAWTEADDGLPRDWSGHGLVFVNPPYGDALPTWIAKMISEAKRGAEIIALIPSRTDTQWLEAATTASDVALWRGRLTFGGAPHPATFPSCVLYFGPRRALFARTLRPYCVRPVLEALEPAWAKPQRSRSAKPSRSTAPPPVAAAMLGKRRAGVHDGKRRAA